MELSEIQMELSIKHQQALMQTCIQLMWRRPQPQGSRNMYIFKNLNLNNEIMEMRNLLIVHNSDSLIINQSSWRAACSLGGHTAIVLLQK